MAIKHGGDQAVVLAVLMNKSIIPFSNWLLSGKKWREDTHSDHAYNSRNFPNEPLTLGAWLRSLERRIIFYQTTGII